MYLDLIQRVKDINLVWKPALTSGNPRLISLQLNILAEEIFETVKAIGDNDRHELRDGLGDIKFVNYLLPLLIDESIFIDREMEDELRDIMACGDFSCSPVDAMDHYRLQLNSMGNFAASLAENYAQITDTHIESGAAEQLMDGELHDTLVFFHKLNVLVEQIAKTFDIDIVADLNEVCDSNASKVDLTESESLSTAEKYSAKGLKVKTSIINDFDRTYYVTLVDGDQQIGDKKYPGNKVMKSINWKEPAWTGPAEIE